MNYGRIDFLYRTSKGITKVGEEYECKTKKDYDKTLSESLDSGIPLTSHIYKKKKIMENKNIIIETDGISHLYDLDVKKDIGFMEEIDNLTHEKKVLQKIIKTIAKVHNIDRKSMMEIVKAASKDLSNNKELEK